MDGSTAAAPAAAWRRMEKDRGDAARPSSARAPELIEDRVASNSPARPRSRRSGRPCTRRRSSRQARGDSERSRIRHDAGPGGAYFAFPAGATGIHAPRPLRDEVPVNGAVGAVAAIARSSGTEGGTFPAWSAPDASTSRSPSCLRAASQDARASRSAPTPRRCLRRSRSMRRSSGAKRRPRSSGSRSGTAVGCCCPMARCGPRLPRPPSEPTTANVRAWCGRCGSRRSPRSGRSRQGSAWRIRRRGTRSATLACSRPARRNSFR